MKTYCKENIRLIFSIIFTLIILIGATYLWQNLKNNYALADNFAKTDKQVIELKDVIVCNDQEGKKMLGYNFIISSNYDINKDYNVQIVSDKIKNEDIHYTIDNSKVMSLNSDKIILKKNIDAKGEHKYLFKVWLTNDYQENDINVLINFI